jgi:hypothetical protein
MKAVLEDVGLTDASAGSMRGLYLVVPDIEASRRELIDRGVSVGEIRYKDAEGGWRGGFRPGLDPDRADTQVSPISAIPTAMRGPCKSAAIADVL